MFNLQLYWTAINSCYLEFSIHSFCIKDKGASFMLLKLKGFVNSIVMLLVGQQPCHKCPSGKLLSSSMEDNWTRSKVIKPINLEIYCSQGSSHCSILCACWLTQLYINLCSHIWEWHLSSHMVSYPLTCFLKRHNQASKYESLVEIFVYQYSFMSTLDMDIFLDGREKQCQHITLLDNSMNMVFEK